MPDSLLAPSADAQSREAFHQSWYPLALSGEVTASTPLGVDFLGTRVVVYRGADGKPVVQGAYCPHLGADLSLGAMIDGQLRCPFHHWRFGADGRCAHIPTGDHIPPNAAVPVYPSAEAWGLIWAFNGTTPLFAPPRIPDADEESLVIEAACYGPRPIEPWMATSNGVDFQHLRALHGLQTEMPTTVQAGPNSIEFTVETPFYGQRGLITGTNVFAQHLRRGDDHMWMLFTGRSVARGRSMSYYVAGVAPGPGAAQRLAATKEMMLQLMNEDAPVLNTMRFRKGTLIGADRFLARFLKYVADFPVAAAQD